MFSTKITLLRKSVIDMTINQSKIVTLSVILPSQVSPNTVNLAIKINYHSHQVICIFSVYILYVFIQSSGLKGIHYSLISCNVERYQKRIKKKRMIMY